jgi:hypothetical protein
VDPVPNTSRIQRISAVTLRVIIKLFLSIMVVSIPFLYVEICHYHEQNLPIDKTPFVYWSGLDPHHEVYVVWETGAPTKSTLKYGTDANNLDLAMLDDAPKTLHRFHLTGLSPDTRYYYQAGAADSLPSGRTQKFKTAPVESKEFNATFISDTQEIVGIGYHNTVASAISRNLDTAFVVNAGDLTQTAESQSLWNLFFRESVYLDHIPFVPCPGNHDAIDSPESKYVKYFGLTANGRDVFYSFDWGNARFIITQIGTRSHVDPANPRNEAHFKWLEETLAASQDKDYRILVCHINRIETMEPLVEKYNVSLLIHGHAHSYSRYMVNKHTYLCLGNGATIQDETIEKDPYVKKKTNGAGFTRLTINPAGINLETFTPAMSTMDQVFLRRDPGTGMLVPDE